MESVVKLASFTPWPVQRLDLVCCHMAQPEDEARENIDRMLSQAGWAVQDPGSVHLSAYRGLAIRNFTLKPGHGFADYLLCIV